MEKMIWHRSRRGDLGLRLAGFVTCFLSYAAFTHLTAVHVHDHPAHAGEIGFAALAVITALAGSCLLFLGSHLFDPVQVSSRWGGRINLVQQDGERLVQPPPNAVDPGPGATSS